MDAAGGAERSGEGGQSGYDELKHGLPDFRILFAHNDKGVLRVQEFKSLRSSRFQVQEFKGSRVQGSRFQVQGFRDNP